MSRRVLWALAEARTKEAGHPLDVDAVLHAAWPGERVAASAGTVRVQNAIKSLRRRGLRDILVTDEGGFLLDPRVTLLRVDSKTT